MDLCKLMSVNALPVLSGVFQRAHRGDNVLTLAIGILDLQNYAILSIEAVRLVAALWQYSTTFSLLEDAGPKV